MAWKLSPGLKNALLGTGSFKEIFANCQIRIYDGAQATGDSPAESGNLLCIITLGSGAMASGVATNGLNFANPVGVAVGKPTAAIWSGVNLMNGTARSFRIYPNDFTAHIGEGDDKIWLEGAAGTTSAQMLLISTSLVKDRTTSVDNVNIEL